VEAKFAVAWLGGGGVYQYFFDDSRGCAARRLGTRASICLTERREEMGDFLSTDCIDEHRSAWGVFDLFLTEQGGGGRRAVIVCFILM